MGGEGRRENGDGSAVCAIARQPSAARSETNRRNQNVGRRSMAVATAITGGEPLSAAAAMKRPSRFGDKALEWLTLAMALAVVLLIILIGWQLGIGCSVAIKELGF